MRRRLQDHSSANIYVTRDEIKASFCESAWTAAQIRWRNAFFSLSASIQVLLFYKRCTAFCKTSVGLHPCSLAPKQLHDALGQTVIQKPFDFKMKNKMCISVSVCFFPLPFVCLFCVCVCVCVCVYGWVDCCWNYTLSVPFKDKNFFIFQSQMQPQGCHVLTTGWSSDFQTDAHIETLMWGRTDARDRWETWGRKYESISLHLPSSRSLKPYIRPFELIIGVILTNEHVFSFKQALWGTPRQSNASECDIKRQHKSQLHYFLCKDAVCVGLTPPRCCDSP